MSDPATLRQFVREFPSRGGAPALVAAGDASLETESFADLSARVERGAAALVRAGVGKGEAVAILAPNSPDWVAAALATLEAGAVVTPLDPQLDDGALARVLDAGRCRFAFTTAAAAARFPGLSVFLLDGDPRDAAAAERLFSGGAEAAARLPEIGRDDAAALFFTSGTTGIPKGVPLTHGNIASNLAALLEERLVGPGDRLLLPLPLHHVYPFTVGMLTPLASGSALVFPSGITGPEIVRALKEARVTAIVAVPRLYASIVAGLDAKLRERGAFARLLFRALLAFSRGLARRAGVRIGRTLFRSLHARLGPSVRAIASGGARLDPDLAWTLEGLGWQVCTGYGLTETSPILTFNARGKRRLESAGRPIRGVELRIDRTGEGGADGAGEVQARGPGVFAGYRNDPERTAKAFTKDGWFKTGDLGRIDGDGFLHLVGRVSEMIVRADGKNVQPEDVEAAFAGHPFIAEIAVLERGGKLVGLVLPEKRAIVESGGGLSPRECVRAAIDARSKTLPSYLRLQAFALAADALPRTRLGKLRRHLLPEIYDLAAAGRAPEPAPPPLTTEDRALLEDPVAARVLTFLGERFPATPVGPDTSPQLDLGIDSLEWVNLTLEIEERTGVALDEAAVGRVHAVRDLLREAIAAAGDSAKGKPRLNPLADPDAFLGEGNVAWLRPLGPAAAAASAALSFVLGGAFRGLFRLSVTGAGRLPESGPFVLVPNHLSDLDPFALAAALPRRVLRSTYWAGATVRLFTGRVTRALSRLGRVVPIDARGGAQASLAFGAAVLSRGRNLVWFPEGQRSFDGNLQPFLPGIGHLLSRHPVQAVPVAIGGTFEAWPRGARRPRLVPLRVAFGEPVDPRSLAPDGDPARIVAGLRLAVEKLLSEASAATAEAENGGHG